MRLEIDCRSTYSPEDSSRSAVAPAVVLGGRHRTRPAARRQAARTVDVQTRRLVAFGGAPAEVLGLRHRTRPARHRARPAAHHAGRSVIDVQPRRFAFGGTPAGSVVLCVPRRRRQAGRTTVGAERLVDVEPRRLTRRQLPTRVRVLSTGPQVEPGHTIGATRLRELLGGGDRRARQFPRLRRANRLLAGVRLKGRGGGDRRRVPLRLGVGGREQLFGSVVYGLTRMPAARIARTKPHAQISWRMIANTPRARRRWQRRRRPSRARGRPRDAAEANVAHVADARARRKVAADDECVDVERGEDRLHRLRTLEDARPRQQAPEPRARHRVVRARRDCELGGEGRAVPGAQLRPRVRVQRPRRRLLLELLLRHERVRREEAQPPPRGA